MRLKIFGLGVETGVMKRSYTSVGPVSQGVTKIKLIMTRERYWTTERRIRTIYSYIVVDR